MNKKQAHDIVYKLKGHRDVSAKLIVEAYINLYPYTAKTMLDNVWEELRKKRDKELGLDKLKVI